VLLDQKRGLRLGPERQPVQPRRLHLRLLQWLPGRRLELWLRPENPYELDLNSPEYAEMMYGLKKGFYVECSVTQAEVIAMFADAHDPCSFTKINGPYTCVHTRLRSAVLELNTRLMPLRQR
jgi:hypothetical protein